MPVLFYTKSNQVVSNVIGNRVTIACFKARASDGYWTRFYNFFRLWFYPWKKIANADNISAAMSEVALQMVFHSAAWTVQEAVSLMGQKIRAMGPARFLFQPDRLAEH